jgi:murein L,D-transpeptidase YcbB/YkuD
LAGGYPLRIAMMLLLCHAPGATRVAAAQSSGAEAMQLRISALAEDPRVAGEAVADRWFLARFYERREFSPGWGTPAKLAALLEAVADSGRHGLAPADYHYPTLSELIAATRAEPSPDLAMELDILATDALARLAFHLRFGKVNPVQVEPTWNFSRSIAGINPVAAIQGLVDADELGVALDALTADSDYYRGLMATLAEYRGIAGRGGWPAIVPEETLRIGSSSASVSALRARLAVTGDLDAETAVDDEQVFGAALEDAVRRFQSRHGLDSDGAVGRRTLAALNVPVEARIGQLRANMERARWVFRDLEERYLLVNIARFQVMLVVGRQVTWSARAVVGRPYRQTPVFKARMRYLEFNPTWTVPPTILTRDLLPEIRFNPAALGDKGMIVLDHLGQQVDAASIDWATIPARGFPYMIRQEPGPGNALGRVKFMFPNPHHIYIHDTPSRELFGRAERAFSSGCIRLERPFELVNILLAGTRWDEPAIERVLASGRTRVVHLPEPVTVLILYGTAVPEGGRIHFLPDVYQRDQRLLTALDAPFIFSPPAGYEESLRQEAH